MLLLLACLNGDADGDGFAGADDCDDNNASRYPDAEEVCDGVDNNCNGLVDEGAGELLLDLDGDGYGGEVVLTSCASGPTSVEPGDCNDGNPNAFPGAAEICNGMDEDCDGVVDEEPTDAQLWYVDADGDGWGDAENTEYGCLSTEGLVAVAGDCDDARSATYPGALETCDGKDEDCNGHIDDNAQDGTTWYADLDLDGYGGVVTQVSCDAPGEHWVADGGLDCNDGDPLTNPDADERCDERDNDCDGTVDEDDAIDALTWYADTDEDGYGDEGATTTACSEPEGFVDDATDCDDDESTTNPGEDEVCRDEVDNDCDDTVNDCQFTDIETQDADAYWYGDSDDYVGHSVAIIDMDGDGYDDVAFGAIYDDSDNKGRVYFAFGAATVTGDVAADDLDSFYGYTSSQYLGRSLANVGDVDADGNDDLLIGATGNGSSNGRVYLVTGGNEPSGDDPISSETYFYSNTNSYFGYSVGGAGDLDGDGYDDMLVGGYYYNSTGHGRVWLLYGDSSFSSMSLDSEPTFTSDTYYAYLGHRNSVSGVGDLDGDGYDDLAMGAYRYEENYNYEGCTGLLYGSSTQVSGSTSFPGGLDAEFHGDEHYANMGVVGHAGDIDNDGYDDLLIGAWGAHSYRGEVYLYYGGVTAFSGDVAPSDSDASFRGEDNSDYLGYMVEGADLDDDGTSELILSAKYNSTAASGGGSVYILGGGTWTGVHKVHQVASATISGSYSNEYVGTSMATGDIDSDGYTDLVVSGDYARNPDGDWGAGGVWLFQGTGL